MDIFQDLYNPINPLGCGICGVTSSMGSGARVPFPSRVAGHAQRCGQYGASRGGIRSQGEEGGRARTDSRRPACNRFAGNRKAGFRRAPRTPSLVGAAIGRVRGVPSAERVGAPTTQQGCPQTARERYRSTPDPYLLMPHPERSLPSTVSTTRALPSSRSDFKSTRRSLCRPGSSLQTRRSRRCSPRTSR